VQPSAAPSTASPTVQTTPVPPCIAALREADVYVIFSLRADAAFFLSSSIQDRSLTTLGMAPIRGLACSAMCRTTTAPTSVPTTSSTPTVYLAVAGAAASYDTRSLRGVGRVVAEAVNISAADVVVEVLCGSSDKTATPSAQTAVPQRAVPSAQSPANAALLGCVDQDPQCADWQAKGDFHIALVQPIVG
jgi:hypothetical protein